MSCSLPLIRHFHTVKFTTGIKALKLQIQAELYKLYFRTGTLSLVLLSHSNVPTEQFLLKYRASEVVFCSLPLFSITPIDDILYMYEKLSVNLIV